MSHTISQEFKATKMSSVTSAIGAKHTCQSILVPHHKSVHMGEKFQCPECEYQATLKGNLIRHQQTVHLGRNLH